MPLLQAIGLFAERFFQAQVDDPKRPKLQDNLEKLLFKVNGEVLSIPPPRHAIEFYPLYDTPFFTMCIFVLKKGSVMPIHDHPQMTVFSRVVYGQMHVRTFSINDTPDSCFEAFNPRINQRSRVFKALIPYDRIVSAESEESLMRISDGPNLHSFEAVSEYVILLDILGPPYNEERECAYFRELNNEISKSDSQRCFPIPSNQHQKVQEEFLASQLEGKHSHPTKKGVFSFSPTSSTSQYTWLMEDDSIDYACVEMEYGGNAAAAVRALHSPPLELDKESIERISRAPPHPEIPYSAQVALVATATAIEELKTIDRCS